MLIEQEKFSDDMDPQEMDENLQLLRGRTLSRLVDERLSPYLKNYFSHTPLPSFTEEERRTDRDKNFH